MKAQRVRETFLQYFADRGHRIVRSSPLLPKDDPTILFTNAGMNQFKNVFLGLEKRGYDRAVSVQKCMRVSGKHNDLETVGRTAKHHTFFEMLGNFSFGDYFKKEAVAFAWDLVTRVYGLPADRLYATVYLDDDEAFRLWAEEVGVPRERIFRYGKKDNFWAMGDTGPCGPCSELHFDLGADIEAGEPFTLIEKGSDRFVELWNLVFMEFDQGPDGVLRPLPSPSIDTGMGLERMTAVVQGKRSNFDTDLFMPLIEAAAAMAKREYPAGDEGDVALRVIADHVRATTFLIGDGVSPANDGRGYVLRRLIRRASRQGTLAGIDRPFLFELVGRVADIMQDAYPELLASAEYISKVCLAEEERFAATLASGLRTFDLAVREARESGGAALSGAQVFRLYDTFGFPLDLSQELAREQGLSVDEAGFSRELEDQKRRARLSWKGEAKRKEKQVYDEFKDLKVRGRVHDARELADVRVLGLLKDGRRAEALAAGEAGEIILEETPFYAEAGGQVGDTGTLRGPKFSALVENVTYATPEVTVHAVKVLAGEVREGDRVVAAPDLVRRQAVSNNHTATHLLHAALRQVLGEHVKQSGSLVSPSRLRFDFSHFAPLSREEVRRLLVKPEDVAAAEAIKYDYAGSTRNISSGFKMFFPDLPDKPVKAGDTLFLYAYTLTGHTYRSGLLPLYLKLYDQPELVDAALTKQKEARHRQAQEARFVRVHADKLDSLINLVGELVIAGAGVGLKAARNKDRAMMESVSGMARLVEDIRDGAMRLRMVEIGETFNRFRRVVRERKVTAVYTQDMGKADWTKPTGNWIDARTAVYVRDSKVMGSMGPTFAAFAERPAAEAFVKQHGGTIVNFGEVTPEMADLRGGAHHDHGM